MAKYTKQKSGLYRTSIQIGYNADGKPKKKYFSAPTIKELEQKVFDAKSDMLSGLIVNDKTTFGSYAEKWLQIYKSNKAVQTQIMYRNAVRRFEELYPLPMRKINRLMIQKIINEYADHPRTAKINFITLKQIFDFARDDGILSKNPCSGIDLPRYVPNERRALTAEEKQKLRSAVLQPQERLLLLLLYGTGCRPSEAYALTKSDFDFENNTISITKSAQFDVNKFTSVYYPKTNQSIRTITVSDSICRGLQHVLEKIPTENVLGDKDGQIMTRAKYNGIFRRILTKAGLYGSGISQYTFRHNFCTECWYAGISIKECMRQMGHKDYRMVLEVYSHLDATKENTKEKLSAMIM